jgi:hypothetical protein
VNLLNIANSGCFNGNVQISKSEYFVDEKGHPSGCPDGSLSQLTLALSLWPHFLLVESGRFQGKGMGVLNGTKLSPFSMESIPQVSLHIRAKSLIGQVIEPLNLVPFMGDEMDASIHRTGVAMRHTGIGRP